MSAWLPVIGLAAAAMLAAVLLLRVQRDGWTLIGAALMFGLAGYGWHGSPGLPAAPKQAAAEQVRPGEAMVAARRALFDNGGQPPPYIMLSDGFARQGRYGDAAALLRDALNRNPKDAEGWLALANALVEHADGRITPPALYAYERARDAFPAHPGAGYFLGMAFLRSGDAQSARRVWRELLERSPDDAPWREDLAFRVERLDELLGRMRAMRGAGAELPAMRGDAPPAAAGAPRE